MEQQVFPAGEGVIKLNWIIILFVICMFAQKWKLVDDFRIYIKYIDLEQCEQFNKHSATGLMREGQSSSSNNYYLADG